MSRKQATVGPNRFFYANADESKASSSLWCHLGSSLIYKFGLEKYVDDFTVYA